MGCEAEITVCGTPLAPITSFRYLGRVLSAADNNWSAVVSNLQKARRKWAQLMRVLRRDGEDARNSGQIYLEMVHLVLLYGSETWVTKPCIERVLSGFHHRVDRRLTGRQPW